MGSDFSDSSHKININDFYVPKQLLVNQTGKPILLQLKPEHSTNYNFRSNFIKTPLIEKYSFAVLQKQFNFQEQKYFYQLRKLFKSKASQKNNQNIYSNQQVFIKKQNQLQKSPLTNIVQVFQYSIQKQPYSRCLNNDYILQVYIQHIPIRLADIKKNQITQNNPNFLWNQLLYDEALYVYFSCLKGYNQIQQNFKSSKENLALPTQYNVGFNCQGQVKIWITNDFSRNINKTQQKNSSEEIMQQLITLIAQRCVNCQQFKNQTNSYIKTSFLNQIYLLQKNLFQQIKSGEQKIKNRFRAFQKDNYRWRYSKEKLSMKSNSINCSPAVQKSQFNQQKNIASNAQHEQNQLRRRYHSQSKLKYPTLFYKQNIQTQPKKVQKSFQSRLRSVSQNNKYSFATNTFQGFNNKLNINPIVKNVEIRNNQIIQKQSNKSILGSPLNNVCMSPIIKKNIPPSPSKNNVKFDYSNSGKNNYSQSVTNIYTLTNHGSPVFLQNPSQFYLNKPVTTLLSDPIISQSSKRNKQFQNNHQQDKLYYKNKSFKQNEMAKFIQQKLNFRQSGENSINKNQKFNTKSNRTTSELGKKSSSKLFFQDSNKKNEKQSFQKTDLNLQIKQFILKDPEQVKTKNILSTQRQEPTYGLQIQGFQKVKQNKPICETSRKNLPILQNFSEDQHKPFSIQILQNQYYQPGNSHLSVSEYQNRQSLHHSISSVKIPTSVQLQNSRSIANKSKEDFNQEGWLKKEQSLKLYKLILEKAIHSNQQIQQIKPIILPKNPDADKFKQFQQVLDQKYDQQQKNMALSSQQLASQFKKLLQSAEIELDDQQNQYCSPQSQEYDLEQLLIKKQSSKKKQTLDDFIDQFNIQITQMSEEDDQSFIDKNEEHPQKIIN